MGIVHIRILYRYIRTRWFKLCIVYIYVVTRKKRSVQREEIIILYYILLFTIMDGELVCMFRVGGGGGNIVRENIVTIYRIKMFRYIQNNQK
jgi:hypothetical protein